MNTDLTELHGYGGSVSLCPFFRKNYDMCDPMYLARRLEFLRHKLDAVKSGAAHNVND